MTWPRVILFALITAVVTGVIMQVPALNKTSLHNMGESFEVWILFAVIICSNCKKPLEAALKTFVFFLISQPLIYLVEWPMLHRFPWDFYKFWFILTLLTLPGGFVAWYVRKKNTLSAVILAVPCSYLAYFAVLTLVKAIQNNRLPLQLGAVIFCIAQIILYLAVFLPEKKDKFICLGISVIAAFVLNFNLLFGKLDGQFNFDLDGVTENSTYVMEDPTLADVIPADGWFTILIHKAGDSKLTFTDPNGKTVELMIHVDHNGYVTCEEL